MVAVGFVALLSFGAFLTFRSMTRSALRRMDRDNERLALLLRGSSSLSAVEHLNAALESAAASATDLVDAQAACVFLESKGVDGPVLCAQAGHEAESLYAKHADWIEEMVASCIESGRTSIREAEAGGPAAIAVPLSPEQDANGALVVLRTEGIDFEPEDADALAALGGLASVAIHNADLRDSQRNFFSHVTDILVTALDSPPGLQPGPRPAGGAARQPLRSQPAARRRRHGAPPLRGAAPRHRDAQARSQPGHDAGHLQQALRPGTPHALPHPAVAGDRAHRLPPPRALRRRRLSRRPIRPRDPAGVADHFDLRRGRQHDLGLELQPGQEVDGGGSGGGSRSARALSSIRSW